MAGCALIRSPFSIVRVAIIPSPFTGMGFTSKGISRSSFGFAAGSNKGGEVKAGNLDIRRAIEGLVRIEMPRLL